MNRNDFEKASFELHETSTGKMAKSNQNPYDWYEKSLEGMKELLENCDIE